MGDLLCGAVLFKRVRGGRGPLDYLEYTILLSYSCTRAFLACKHFLVPMACPMNPWYNPVLAWRRKRVIIMTIVLAGMMVSSGSTAWAGFNPENGSVLALRGSEGNVQ